MVEKYSDKIKVRIGRIKAVARSNDYFPIVGKTITIDAETRWGQTSEWHTQDGTGNTAVSAGNLVLQKDIKHITVAAAGELSQKFVGRNSVSEVEVVKAVYAMDPQTLPYFDVSATETVRVGDTGYIRITAENGYPTSRNNTIIARIYRENESEAIKNVGFDTARPGPTIWASSAFSFDSASDRGIYDVEVDVTDTLSGITLTKRINKLITVVPALCPQPADKSTGYEVVHSYTADTGYGSGTFELKLWRNVGGSGLNYAEAVIPRGAEGNGSWSGLQIYGLPAATTLCLLPDVREPEGYPRRLFLAGSKDPNAGNENGTPNFTYDSPLVVTHDTGEVMEWNWLMYGALQFQNNCRNIVLDGYGYNNTGIHMLPWKDAGFVDSCIYMNNGTSDVEVFGIDIDGAGFAGITAKTDPSGDRPWFGLGEWEFKNLRLHHTLIRNTVGEGVYLGYFNNDAGAHIMRDIRLYRCEFRDNGYDSVQVNNAVGIEFCYNLLTGCGYRREPSQGSAFSCTMDGRVYNNIVKNNYNVVGVMWPYSGRLEMFNNVLTAARMEYGFTIRLYDGREFYIYNNVIKAREIAGISDRTTEGGSSRLQMDDNVIITEKGETQLPPHAVGTGNLFFQADEEYEAIDAWLKVADSANYDYQPAHNSPAVTAGKNGKSPFDMRGYKNWYIGQFHAGPLMGKYKDESIVDVQLAMTGIRIAGGTAYTYAREVTVQLQYAGTPTRYRIGETADLSGVAWSSLGEVEDGVVMYTLSDVFGNKTVYAQVGNANDESAVVSSGIEYRKEPVTATMVLNGGKTMTTDAAIPVSFVVNGVYASLEYMLSEVPGFAGASYAPYDAGAEVQFTLSSGKGLKTVYGKIKSDDAQEIAMEGKIDYVNDKLILAMYEVKSAKDVFDSENGITRRLGWPTLNQQLFSISNKAYCKFSFIANGPEMKGISTVSNNSTTGNDSGAYPDIYLAYSFIFSPGYETADNVARVQFSELPPGSYRLRILSNGDVGAWSPDSVMKSYILVDEEEYLVADKGLETFADNFTQLMEWDVVVGEDGLLTVGAYCKTKWRTVPINIIELEMI